ncbi:MAG: hypothetical protein AAF449_01920, partial [Myxococcota bacterium]
MTDKNDATSAIPRWTVTVVSAGPLLLFVLAAAAFGQPVTAFVTSAAQLASTGFGLFWQLLVAATFVVA